jgi:hypothetical protein
MAGGDHQQNSSGEDLCKRENMGYVPMGKLLLASHGFQKPQRRNGNTSKPPMLKSPKNYLDPQTTESQRDNHPNFLRNNRAISQLLKIMHTILVLNKKDWYLRMHKLDLLLLPKNRNRRPRGDCLSDQSNQQKHLLPPIMVGFI